jgi:hypothetical protein
MKTALKINQKKLSAFRKNQVREYFSTPAGTYDIVLAKFLIDDDMKDSEVVSVDELAANCGFVYPAVSDKDGFLSFKNKEGMRVVVDHAHAQKDLDLDIPLILNSQSQLIDGHHRLYRAYMLGVEWLNAYTLLPEETSVCLS